MYSTVLRDPQSLVAHNGSSSITVSSFLHSALSLSEQLPEQRYAINLCRDRLNFFYALISVAARGQCNLLPPNGQTGTIDTLVADYPDSYVLHDGYAEVEFAVPAVDIRQLQTQIDGLTPQAPLTADNPITVKPDHVAAISFTSGSTGQSRPNIKTWSMLLEGARINADNMLIGAPEGLQILATVPSQHMYGLELTITLPLVADVQMHSGQPLYPNDVQAALQKMPAPRALVSTPQHLRALLASKLAYPHVERIFSATAPMDQALARQVESCFGGELVEIYGCSEIGSIARRCTAREHAWTPFSAMTFTTTDETTTVSAAHVPDIVELQDHIEQHADGSFDLKGRFGDLINIAGKRGSLAQLNQLLLAVPEVEDGVIFQPAPSSRLAAIVVGEQADKKSIVNTLREHVDPVFIPRPILFSDALPRTETSKLPRQLVLDYFQELKSRMATKSDGKA